MLNKILPFAIATSLITIPFLLPSPAQNQKSPGIWIDPVEFASTDYELTDQLTNDVYTFCEWISINDCVNNMRTSNWTPAHEEAFQIWFYQEGLTAYDPVSETVDYYRQQYRRTL